MARLRRISATEVPRVLHRSGFEVVAQRGSHAKLARVSPDGERQVLTVPLHRNLATGMLLAIYRQAARLAPSVALRNGFFTD